MKINYSYKVLCNLINRWDAFNQTPDTGGSASEKHTDCIKKASYCIKIMMALLTFIVVLVAACFSKVTVFFMIAQIRIPSNVTDSQNYNLNNPPLEYCPENIPNRPDTNDTTYYVEFGETQSISWMW